MMSFPPFSGATSQLVIANVAVYFLLLLMRYAAPQMLATVIGVFGLSPALVFHGWIWQLGTYSFLHMSLLQIAFNMLTLWFIGSYLESARGTRWFLETYFLSVVGGAVIGCLFSRTHLFHASPFTSFISADAAIFGLLAAFGVLFGDLELYMFPLPISVKAKYLVIVYMLIELAMLMSGGPAAVLACSTILGGALLGFLYARRTPRRRMAANPLGNRIFEFRNSYYRWKRRRAARKFEVYMRKQNRDVHFDDEGRYIEPDERKQKR